MADLKRKSEGSDAPSPESKKTKTDDVKDKDSCLASFKDFKVVKILRESAQAKTIFVHGKSYIILYYIISHVTHHRHPSPGTGSETNLPSSPFLLGFTVNSL